MPPSLREAYDARLAAGALTPDPGQAAGLAALSDLAERLGRARPAGLLRRAEPVKGVYLFGPVGRGKSMLMDLFFAAARIQRKRRAHFHAFMAEVHGLARIWRSGEEAARREAFGEHPHGRSGGDDPIPPLARRIAAGARLLCFDELEVNDIGDAMILGRLFEALFARGVTVVATSNRPPDELYLDGINRQLFLPFIDLLKTNMEVVAVDGPRDWRAERLRAARAWFSPIDPDNERAFDALWRDVLGGAGEAGVTLTVLGRTQHWPRAQARLLRAGFASLCGQALGPADYLAIAERFGTVFLEDLPRLTPDRREEARRLTLLVDSLYEARARLVILAETEPERLYPAGDLAFAFQRTASRLAEMRSREWGSEPQLALAETVMHDDRDVLRALAKEETTIT